MTTPTDNFKDSLQMFLLSGQTAMHITKDVARAVIAALDAPMTEDEILQRARRAVSEFTGFSVDDICMTDAYLSVATQALRDLDKPLVDPVVLACRAIVCGFAIERKLRHTPAEILRGDADDSLIMQDTIAAYRAGQDSPRAGDGTAKAAVA